MRLALLFVFVLMLPVSAMADGRALLLGNVRTGASTMPGADRITRAAPGLEAAGFTVIAATDLSAAGLRERLGSFHGGVDGSRRLVIALAGHFAHSASGSWFLGADARRPGLAEAGAAGLHVETVLEIAAAVPGGAVVLLATETRPLPLGPGLRPGLGVLSVPQGVTLIRGTPPAVAAFVAGDLLRPGVPLVRLVSGVGGLTAEGFLPPYLPFLPDIPETDPDTAVWEAARSAGTRAALEGYLASFPDGRHATAAREALGRLARPVDETPEDIEAALGLTREQRLTIQRNLTTLGFDTRGVDGIFGPGTRAAIGAWQRGAGLPANGFLTRDQIGRLAADAARRAAEIEAEEAARRAEAERADRAFWDATGGRGDEAGLRAYLARYPEGLYADIARMRIAAIEEDRGDAPARRDRAAWDRARTSDTVAAYRRYLDAWPEGAFAAAARARILELEDAAIDPDLLAAARREEQALNLNPFTRNLIESRLQALGLDPGRVDGRFDEDTRRAIRQYQRARNLPVTGYVNEALVARIIADTLRILAE